MKQVKFHLRKVWKNDMRRAHAVRNSHVKYESITFCATE